MLVGGGIAPAATRSPGGPLSIDERIGYQAAIEQVRYRHRIWPTENPAPKPTFEELMPPTALDAKVDDYLRKSHALEARWKRPVTALQLQAEMDRMARDTKDPTTLQELFAACDNDPHVIAECLARQSLVDREIHDWYVSPNVRFDTWWGRARERFRSAVAEPPEDGYRFPMVRAAGPCTPDSWHTMSFAPAVRSQHTAVWTGSEMIVWGGRNASGALNTGSRYAPSTDSWVPTSMGPNVPDPRYGHTAVWTGTEMIVWGGPYTNTGARYDPTNDSWTATSYGANVPAARGWHTAVWTGTELIVWGGIGAADTSTPEAGTTLRRMLGQRPASTRTHRRAVRITRRCGRAAR